jgi:hypothetical protein
MRTFKLFDYFVIAVGIIGTLNVFGAPIRMLQLIVIVLGTLSALICCFSILSLALNRFVPRLDPQQQRIHVYHILVNLIPTIYILTHLTETPWERFTC